MSRVTTYNPKKVACALGRHIASGFAEDSMITIDQDGDGTTHVVGAYGDVARSIDPSDVHIVKVSLQQGSPTNAFLQKMYDIDKKNGTGLFPINIVDELGNEKFSCSQAWVKKEATFTRGKAATNREWEIVAADGTFE